jgi:DNA polymerase-3 subunit delta
VSKETPRVYLLHGSDEYAITRFIADLRSKMGDAAIAELNLTRLDGRSLTLDELVTATQAIPFLARRRLILLSNPTAFPKSPAERERLLKCLEQVPQSAAVVLIEPRLLTDERSRKKGDLHWLEKWARENSDWVLMRSFERKRGRDMAEWIQAQAESAGGKFTPRAAGLLASAVGDNARLAAQEIEKLLLYVNFQRPVDEQDIRQLTAYHGEVGDFALVNALRARDRHQASFVLHRMLEKGEPLIMLGSIVYQFRLVLLARELLDEGFSGEEVKDLCVKHLKVNVYPVELALQQARAFTLPALEGIYRRLLDADIAIKSGGMDDALALEVLVETLTD